MIINSLNKMEEIVKSSSDISWDGMTVVILMNEDGYYTKNGVFDNGVWKTKYRFSMVDYHVWNIPDRYLAHVQV